MMSLGLVLTLGSGALALKNGRMQWRGSRPGSVTWLWCLHASNYPASLAAMDLKSIPAVRGRG